jgi:hypothetical protein
MATDEAGRSLLVMLACFIPEVAEVLQDEETPEHVRDSLERILGMAWRSFHDHDRVTPAECDRLATLAAVLNRGVNPASLDWIFSSAPTSLRGAVEHALDIINGS